MVLQSCLPRKRMGVWGCVLTTEPSTITQSLIGIPYPELMICYKDSMVLGCLANWIWGMGTTRYPWLLRISTRLHSVLGMDSMNLLSCLLVCAMHLLLFRGLWTKYSLSCWMCVFWSIWMIFWYIVRPWNNTNEICIRFLLFYRNTILGWKNQSVIFTCSLSNFWGIGWPLMVSWLRVVKLKLLKNVQLQLLSMKFSSSLVWQITIDNL